jgi:Amidohydrolase family
LWASQKVNVEPPLIKVLKRIGLFLSGLLVICFLWLFVLLSWPLPNPPGPVSTAPLLLDNVSIVEVETGQIKYRQSVWIDAGRISKITDSDSAVADDKANIRTDLMEGGRLKVSAAGRFLMPGLSDMHTHSLQVSPQLHHPLWIAAGVTTVRDMSGCILEPDSFWGCTKDRKRWQQQLQAGNRTSPNYWQHGSYQTNGGREVPKDFPAFLTLQTAADAKLLLAHYQAQGVDFIKVYENLSAQQYQWLATAAKQAGLGLAGHQPWLVSFTDMLNAGQRSVEHGRVFLLECADAVGPYKQQPLSRGFQAEQWRALLASQNPVLCARLIQQMAASQTWWSPTLLTLQLGAKAVDTAFREDQRLKFVPYLMQLQWQSDADNMLKTTFDDKGVNVHAELLALAQKQLKQAKNSGVKILAGTDTPDSFVFAGSGLHDELALYQRAGLSTLEVIQTATINPAIFAGIADKTGSVAVGKTADLILLSQNPLQDLATLRQPEAVVLAGNWYPKDVLRELELFAEKQANSLRINVRLGWDVLRSAPMRVQFAD